MAKIGVEDTLSDIAQALKDNGHEVMALTQEADADRCDCCVISGQDENVMGIQEIETPGPVIDARGMSAEDVCEEVGQRLT